MAQISKGDTFTDGQQVTGARLNQLVDSSVLLVGAITDQPNLTANTLQSTDSTIVNDAGVLKEATIGDFLNSNLPITTSSITGGAGVDIVVAPAAGQKFDVNGAFEATTSNTTGNSTIGGTLVVTGGSTLTGNVIADNGFTSNGVANFTGALQVNGAVGYVLTEIVEETISINSLVQGASNTLQTLWTSASYTKPAGEIWFIEVAGHFTYNTYTWYAIRLRESASSLIVDGETGVDHGSGSAQRLQKIRFQYPYSASSTFTSTFVLEFSLWGGSYTGGFGYTNLSQILTGYLTAVDFPVNKFRIYKYKTA